MAKCQNCGNEYVFGDCCGNPQLSKRVSKPPQPFKTTTPLGVSKPARKKVKKVNPSPHAATNGLKAFNPKRLKTGGTRHSHAPTVGGVGKFAPLPTSGVTVVDDLTTDKTFFDPSVGGVRLAFANLHGQKTGTPGADGVTGVFITHPKLTGHTTDPLGEHLATATLKTLDAHNPMQVTEALGEAATALTIATKPEFDGFELLHGLHVHSGPGIDQIWHKPKGGPSEPDGGTYLIAEAKGPDQKLNTNLKRGISELDEQMSDGWIYDNLARMARNGDETARKLMDHCGLEEVYKPGKEAEEEPYYIAPGASKRYYRLKRVKGKRTADLKTVVVTAKWESDGSLGGSVSGKRNMLDKPQPNGSGEES